MNLSGTGVYAAGSRREAEPPAVNQPVPHRYASASACRTDSAHVQAPSGARGIGSRQHYKALEQKLGPFDPVSQDMRAASRPGGSRISDVALEDAEQAVWGPAGAPARPRSLKKRGLVVAVLRRLAASAEELSTRRSRHGASNLETLMADDSVAEAIGSVLTLMTRARPHVQRPPRRGATCWRRPSRR